MNNTKNFNVIATEHGQHTKNFNAIATAYGQHTQDFNVIATAHGQHTNNFNAVTTEHWQHTKDFNVNATAHGKHTKNFNAIAVRVIAQAIDRRPLTADCRVQIQAKPCGICSGRRGIKTGFIPAQFFAFRCQYRSNDAHTDISLTLHNHYTAPHLALLRGSTTARVQVKR